MPTYDAEKCKRLADDAHRAAKPTLFVAEQYEPETPSQMRAVEHARMLVETADALLAATQEIERLRKLVGEACEIGMRWACLLSAQHGDPQDRTRLAAIRHAAGLGESKP